MVLGRAVLSLRAVLVGLLGALVLLPACASRRAARTVAGAEPALSDKSSRQRHRIYSKLRNRHRR